jgi:hypothetical protein
LTPQKVGFFTEGNAADFVAGFLGWEEMGVGKKYSRAAE